MSMRRMCAILALLGVPTVALAGPRGGTGGRPPTAAGAVMQAWAVALQEQNTTRLQSLMAGDATYHRLELVGSHKVKRWQDGHVSPTLFPRPAEVQVVKVRAITSQEAVGVMHLVVEEGAVRAWESWLTLRPGGGAGWQVTQISDIAMEGSYPGDPEGCPETSAKRHEAVTLYGKLDGPGEETTVRIFQTRRDTDAWAFATGEAKAEEKKCTPKPGLALEDLEVVVQEASGALRSYQHFGRIDWTTGGGGRGIGLYEGAGGGALVAGGARLYALPGNAMHLFLSRTWRSEKTQTDWRAVHRVDAYRWEGGAFRKVWGFDFGKDGGGLSGDGSAPPAPQVSGSPTPTGGTRVLWSLAAPGADGTIRGSATGACAGSITFTWSGGGFKLQKEGVGGGCLGAWWPGGESGILSMGEVNLERMARKAGKSETDEGE